MVTLIDPLARPENAPASFSGPLEARPNNWKPPSQEGFHKPDQKQFGKTPRFKRTTKDPYGRDPALMADFRNFLTVVWKFLNLPKPSAILLSMAWWLQHGPDRAVILGFRGLSKSWVTGCYCLWKLYCDPQHKILMVSASLDRAVAQVNWALTLIREMPELQFLAPDLNRGQRASSRQFDVGPATPDQAPSFKANGIGGQLAGSRAHDIVGDDIEIPNNSMTPEMRTKVGEQVKEFASILHPGGRIKFLGTPQIEDSLYPKLRDRGYTIRIWPAHYPDKKMRNAYGDMLSPFILNGVLKNPKLAGHSTWPERFPDEDLAKRLLEYGKTGFALQFLLDTRLANADKYPLKLRDLIVDGLDPVMGPDAISWGNSSDLKMNYHTLGFTGDHFHGPASRSKTASKYNSVKATIDSSGRGSNETTITIGGELNSRIFWLKSQGWKDGYGVPTLQAIAKLCVQFRVDTLYIEDNFGDGMFLALLQPHIKKAWDQYNHGKDARNHGGTAIEAITSPRVQKEVRILSVLEPVTQGHRLVVSTSVIEEDMASIAKYQEEVGTDNAHIYSVFYQLTHITRDRDSLLQDDRIEGLAMLCAQYADVLGVDPWEASSKREEQRLVDEYDALMAEAWDISGGETPPPRRWDRTKSNVRPS